MANFSRFPREILLEIISYLSPLSTDLINSSRACKSLGEVATAVLYTHIDLKISDGDDEANVKSEQRQRRLLLSIAENPNLGGLVKTFKSYGNVDFGEQRVVTVDPEADGSVLVNVAKNLRNLSKANLNGNQVSAQMVANLPNYKQLTDLNISGMDPDYHIWNMSPVALKSLRWEVPACWGGDAINQWDTAHFIINVAEATCPVLESLDIFLVDMGGRPPQVPSELAQQYSQIIPSETPLLSKLKHFGFRYTYCPNTQSEIKSSFLNFVKRYKNTLDSVSIHVPHRSCNRENLDFILEVCALLPGLKSLSLVETRSGMEGTDITPLDFFTELTTTLTSPSHTIERFSMNDIQCLFSLSLGRLFQSWPNLKYLRLGDGDNADGPYGDDGQIQLDEYRPELLRFVKALPPSLEELFLEINGEDLMCDEDDDWNPMCNLGRPVFTKLRRLHTFDIHAWISNIDGGLGALPEKGAFYRRLPSSTGSHGAGFLSPVKDIWSSRMDCIYQEEDINVRKKCETVDLSRRDDGAVFEGRDASEVWAGGFTFGDGNEEDEDEDEEVNVEEDEEDGEDKEPDHSWPFYQDKVAWYEGFQARS